MTRFAVLLPVSRTSVRLTGGEPVLTTVSPLTEEDGQGPQCPHCASTMRPLPDREATLVCCENPECLWLKAPFRSDAAAVRPTKKDEEPESV